MSVRNTNPPQLAASSYLNTAPLIWSFKEGSQREAARLITDAAPARCADMLAGGDVEAALVPVIEYQRIPDACIVPGVCVGSHKAVRSVVLVSKVDDLRDVRKVVLDLSSRTSQALVKIIFKEFLNCEPEWQVGSPDIRAMLKEHDAALLIGDPAMKLAPEDGRVFDLASLWHRYTNTGFVFAMWMVRQGNAEAVSRVNFAAARDEGLEQLERVISNYEDKVPLSRDQLRTYLTDNITFHLDESLEEGMRLYFKLADKHGLINEVKSPKFISG
ncbi:MAG TPA: menaquinone biosynthesis protein [Pyrinomonadaceae bacterium]|nr:menaquinone biosynthesis protein [Pyrinomonadaceae bacterium]